MAKINLRAYNREIEILTDQHQFDQAIAHSLHILKTFPKHLQTYRLLGKAYLESQRYGDASDIFQRVLSAIPDDFVSHVGMSIIREDESNLDEAIWHMERAFEVQPANNAIQGELRRLYGRRDGLEPPKVRLTRGALARMYLKGELYPQAISELRAALAENPDRQDLQTLLAQAYYLSGQKVEAANVCSNIHTKMPFSLEANRILANILAGTERSAEGETYRQRMYVLDPYLAQISQAAPVVEKVSDDAVFLEKLVYVPGQSAAGTVSQPDWAASLGVKIDQPQTDEEKLPDWLMDRADFKSPIIEDTIPDSLQQHEEETLSSELPEAEINAEEAIPDWMKSAGWKPASAEAEEQPADLALDDFPNIPEEAAPGDIPEWLKEIAHPDQLDDQVASAADLDADAPPAWIDETIPAPSEDMPDWLSSQTAVEVEGISLPEWSETPEEIPLDAAQINKSADTPEMPDWLEEPAPEESLSEDVSASLAAEIPELEGEIIPVQADEIPSVQANVDDDAAFAWLESLAAKQGAEEALILSPEERRETPPDWVLKAAEQEEIRSDLTDAITSPEASIWEQPTAELEVEETVEAETPDWLSTPASDEWQPIEPLEPDLPLMEITPLESRLFEAEGVSEPAEMEDLSMPSDETLDLPIEPATDLPEWLKDLEAQSAAEPLIQDTGFQPEGQISGGEAASLPDWLKELAPEGSSDDSSDAFVASGQFEPQLSAQPADVPDWLKELDDTSASTPEPLTFETPVGEIQASAAEPAALPDWLKDLGTTTPVEPGAPLEELFETGEPIKAEISPDLPAWLTKTQEEITPETGFSMLFGPQILAAASNAIPQPGEEPPVEIGDTKPTRVRALQDQTTAPQEVIETTVPESLSVVDAEEAVPADEIPDWLRGISEEATSAAALGVAAAQGEALTPEVSEPAAWIDEKAALEASVEQLPDWLRDLGEPETPAFAVEATQSPEEAASQLEISEDTGEVQQTLSELELAEGAVDLPVEDKQPVEDLPAEELPLEELPAAELPTEDLLIAELPAALESVTEEVISTPEVEIPDISEEVSPSITEPAVLPVDDDAAFAWLESLAARQGAEEALLLKPEDRLDAPPDWVVQAAEQAELASASELVTPTQLEGEVAQVEQDLVAEEPLAEIPADTSLPEVEVLEPEAELQPFTPEVEETPITTVEAPVPAEAEASWLFTEEETALEAPKPEAEPVTAEVMPELPSWLADVEERQETADISQWQPPSELEEQQPARIEPAEIVYPLLDLNQAGLVELERLPGIGYIRAQAILEYRNAHGAFDNLQDLLMVEGLDPETVALLSTRLVVNRLEPEPEEQYHGIQDDQQMLLIQARNAFIHGDREKAIQHYQEIIKSKQMLPDVIRDLNEALYRYPVDIAFWQALGDAHVRAGNLQEALDAYTKAEELLR